MSGAIENQDAQLFIENLEKHNIGSDTDYLVSHLKAIEADSVLDIGFGRGDLLCKLGKSNKFKTLVGIEKSVELFENAFDDFKDLKIDCIKGDFLKHEFDQKFDIIIMSFYLHHLEDYKEHLKKAALLLSSDGVIVIVDRIARDDQAKEEFKGYWTAYYKAIHEWHEECPNLLTLKEIGVEMTTYDLKIDDVMFVPNDKRKGVENFPKTLVKISRRGRK